MGYQTGHTIQYAKGLVTRGSQGVVTNEKVSDSQCRSSGKKRATCLRQTTARQARLAQKNTDEDKNCEVREIKVSDSQ
jgi:hypothetical protein